MSKSRVVRETEETDAYTTTHQNNAQETSETSGQNGASFPEQSEYEKLGIVTSRPKHPEYATFLERMQSFERWPESHHLQPEGLAEAGFFYSGIEDTTRCFYCSGILRNWEKDEDVWVEHTRWFPRCPHLLLKKGRTFINTVVEIKREQLGRGIAENKIKITLNDVIHRMGGASSSRNLTPQERSIQQDPAVLVLIKCGFDKDQVFSLALEWKSHHSDELMSIESLFQTAVANNLSNGNDENDLDDLSDILQLNETQIQEYNMDKLRSENETLRKMTICKICLTEEVEIIFMPCNHFISCSECSYKLTSCPLCRKHIKGFLKGQLMPNEP